MSASEGGGPTAGPGARRVHHEHPIRIWFRSFQRPVTELVSNLSLTGMFVVSSSPQPPGSEFDFELEIADSPEPLRGKARVMWLRLPGEEPDRKAGMGAVFTALAPGGRALLARAIERRIREGAKVTEVVDPRDVVDSMQARWHGDPKDVALEFRGAGLKRRKEAREAVLAAANRAAGGARPAGGDPEGQEPKAEARRAFGEGRAEAVRRQRLQRSGLLLIAFGLAVLIGGAALVSWLRQGPAGGLGDQETGVANSAADSPAPGTSAAGAPAGSGVRSEEAAAAVSAWATAWSDQRVEDYLASYSSRFLPPGGMSLAEWRAQRRQRVSRPAWVRVAMRQVEIEPLGPEEVLVRFRQDYSSDSYADSVRKTLTLVREDGGWKILSESVEE